MKQHCLDLPSSSPNMPAAAACLMGSFAARFGRCVYAAEEGDVLAGKQTPSLPCVMFLFLSRAAQAWVLLQGLGWPG